MIPVKDILSIFRTIVISVSLTVLVFFGLSYMYHYFTSPEKLDCEFDFSWDELNYDEAKGYFFSTYQSKETSEIIKSQGKSVLNDKLKLNQAVWDKRGVVFSKEEIEYILGIKKFPFPDSLRGIFAPLDPNVPEIKMQDLMCECYNPHHGIVLRRENGCPVAWLDICFEFKKVKAYPSRNFPGINYDVVAYLFKKKGINPTNNYEKIIEYARKLRGNYNTNEPIYAIDSVTTPPEYVPMIGEKNLIEYFHKGRKANKRITDSITSWYEKITFVVEQNGEVNLVEMEHDDNTLLWIWNTKWKPATINGENVRCRIEKTFYYK